MKNKHSPFTIYHYKEMENLVFSNMLHRPARTLVSIIGIAIGVLLIVFTVGLTNGSLREQAQREANVGAEFFFRASGSMGQSGSESFQLPSSLTKELEKVEGVEKAIAIGQSSVDADTATGKRLIDGINFDEYSQMSGIKIVQGRVFQNDADETIIDTAFKLQKKLKLGDSIKIWERDFKIVGIYEPAGGARIKIPLLTMQKQLLGADSSPNELNKVSAIFVKIKQGFTEDQVGENIQKAFPNNQIIRTKDLEEIYLNSIPALNIFLNVIIGVAATISALVILLTMYTTVTERTRQIGILKSLGMSNGLIAWTLTQEAILISFCGIVLGIVSAYFLKFILTKFITLSMEITFPVLAITLVVGLIGGALGALYPALRAARLDAVEALSYE
jgi:putative ABC transport system permease protein